MEPSDLELDLTETPDFEMALQGFALAAVMAVSADPASEAVNVPGEPRVIGDVLLNCLRFPMDDEESAIPGLDEALIAHADAMHWEDVSVEPDCHYVNIHDLHGRWRIDFSFHYVLGVDPEDDEELPYSVGIAGLCVMETSRVPEEQQEAALARIQQVGHRLLTAHAAGEEGDLDPRWRNIESTALH